MFQPFLCCVLLISFKSLSVYSFENKSNNSIEKVVNVSGNFEKINTFNASDILNKTTYNEAEANLTTARNDNMTINETAVEMAGNQSRTSNQTEMPVSKRPEGRSLKDLSPGAEYLLSVASVEDANDGSWENLPYLKTFIEKGSLDHYEPNSDNKRKPSTGYPHFPNSMMEMISLMTANNKVDKEDEKESAEKPTSFLAKLGVDPMNALVAALIPFSLLLAAVIPVLTNQFMTGLYIPSVYTIATGARKERSLNDSDSTEYFMPILESIASFGAKTFEDITKEKPDETKVRFVKEALEMISNFVNEKWMSLFSGFHRNKQFCSQGNCTSSH
ncbi:uncharacterized protein CDAR_542601 [Caerostris darwini]|uniref:Uncharacterized protein n=1 Tax=Caerostris darwini TaxID=1538125 RepID=A0AAV4RSY6_9ARAC|nr:uncharacterized protein CDAR_542601 [Caerostris darwini]